MTIQVPTNINFLGIREYAGRAPIQAGDWGELCESAHYLFERRGIHLGGRVYPGGITADSTDDFYVSGIPTRILTGGWDVTFAVYGEHFDVSFTLINIDDSSTTVSSTSLIAGGSFAWRTTTDTLTDAEIRDDGTTSGSLTLLYGDIDIDIDEANSGSVYQIDVFATNDIAGTDIPTTP
jgi:hypothetical protein